MTKIKYYFNDDWMIEQDLTDKSIRIVKLSWDSDPIGPSEAITDVECTSTQTLSHADAAALIDYHLKHFHEKV